MKLKPIRFVPFLIASGVIGLVCFLQALPILFPGDSEHDSKFDLFQRLKWITYDWRVRAAARFPTPVSSDLGMPGLGFVAISDKTIDAVLSGEMGMEYGLQWPRSVYAKALRELTTQGARAVAFDVIFGELRPDHNGHTNDCRLPDGSFVTPDEFFAHHLSSSGNAILASSKDQMATDLFRTNAWTIGDVQSDKDSDGITRRVKAFYLYDTKLWHPAIHALVKPLDLRLSEARVEGGKILIPLGTESDEYEVPLNPDGSLNLEEMGAEPSSTPQRPYVQPRVWNLGVALAAQALGLDLRNATIARNKVILRGTNGVERIIPTDDTGNFYIDWSLGVKHEKLTREPFEAVLHMDHLRETGELEATLARAQTEGITSIKTNVWNNKLVVIGSSATGNDLTDRGATPLGRDTFLVSRYWNIANSILVNRFIQPSSPRFELALIIVMGAIAAFLTWQLRVALASGLIVTILFGYTFIAFYTFVNSRYWLPLVFPVIAVLLNYVCLVTYRAIFEQQERKHIKAVFSKMVSADIVNELLQAETQVLGGARREITVFFADVRGFTEYTDSMHATAEDYVRKHNLAEAEAKAYFDQHAAETLDTVNMYLGLIAETIKRCSGTVDKFMGDCVMAFWGAPTSNRKHAVACVRCAIEAQRAIYAKNHERFAENKKREEENIARLASGQEALPMLPLLQLGTGINTGPVTAGLMGSLDTHYNYTVFGREVNIASRLEGVSGRGRIIISEATYLELKQHDPELAATCVEQTPVSVKGIKQAVKIYEVPWKIAPATPAASTAQPALPTTAATATSGGSAPTKPEPVKT